MELELSNTMRLGSNRQYYIHPFSFIYSFGLARLESFGFFYEGNDWTLFERHLVGVSRPLQRIFRNPCRARYIYFIIFWLLELVRPLIYWGVIHAAK